MILARLSSIGVSDLVKRYCREWSLTVDGEPMRGYVSLAIPVRTADGESAVLKVPQPSRMDDDERDEALALRTWAGDGAVRLLGCSADERVLLLEKLVPGHSLHGEPIDSAVEIGGALLRRLAVPAPPGLKVTLATSATVLADRLSERWRRHGEPFPSATLDRALGHCAELGPSAANLLVNYDQHFENVLAAQREPWLVIDPTVLAGDIEFGVLPLLWNRADEFGDSPDGMLRRFDTIVAAAGLDRERALGWTLVRAVDGWLWSLDVDPDHAQARWCPVIVERMMRS